METLSPQKMSSPILKKGEPINISMGKLPQGHFKYAVTIINPFSEEIELAFSLYSEQKLIGKKNSLFSSGSFTESFDFYISKDEHWKNIEISFTLNKGSIIKLHLPLSPRFSQKVEAIPINLKETIEKVKIEIGIEGEKKSPLNTILDEPDESMTHTKQATNIKPSIPLPDILHFKGLLSFEQAQKQLDYVIFNKIFAPNGTKGFKKWKRSLYKKIVISLYRKLFRNSGRKTYFVKLYRNYVNNNIIAENFQGL